MFAGPRSNRAPCQPDHVADGHRVGFAPARAPGTLDSPAAFLAHGSVRGPMSVESFAVASASTGSAWLLFALPVALLPLLLALRSSEARALGTAKISAWAGCSALTVWMVAAIHVVWSESARVELSPEGIRVFGHGSTQLPAAKLLVHKAALIDLTARPGFQPSHATRGVEFGGLRSGWFQLRNGTPAFVVLGDTDRAVFIPASDGSGALVDLERPDDFLVALRKAAGR